MEKAIRKKQSILGISGLAVIVFGLWSVAKMVIHAFSAPDGFLELLGFSSDAEISTEEIAIATVVFISFLVIDLGLRFLVGLSARAESRGEKRSPFYLVVAAFLILYSLSSIFISFQSFFSRSLLDAIVSIVVELTSVLALLELIITSAGIRSIRKKEAAAEN